MDQKLILLADDDRDDTEMFCEALATIDGSVICHCAENGRKLLEILHGLPEMPQLIFMDLNMPVMNGWDCLKLLKADERYKHIPVIMISTSSHEKEIETATKLGALCYFVKPNSFTELTQVLQAIIDNLETGISQAVQHLQTGETRYVFSCAENKPAL